MNFFIASHISDLYGPTEELIKYLINRSEKFVAVLNPLEYCREAKRHVIFFDGKNTKNRNLPNMHRPAVFSWILDFWFVLYFALFTNSDHTIYVGCDPLNGIMGIILKKFGRVHKTVFYTIDWSEKRFHNPILNRFYYLLDSLSVSQSDYIWCVSHRLVKLRQNQGINKEKLLYVPIGIYADQPVYDRKAKKLDLVFLGALERTKGIEIVMDAWSEIVKMYPEATLHIIGASPGNQSPAYEHRLSGMSQIKLHGILSHDKIIKILPKFGIGLAPYSPDKNSVTKYADPSRIKDYLASCLPIIATDMPEISSEIAEFKAGEIIEYSKAGLIAAIKKISGKNFWDYKNGAQRLAQVYNWNEIFSNAFIKIQL